MPAISGKDLKFYCICFLKDGLQDIPIFHIYHVQSQFEPRLTYSKAISSILISGVATGQIFREVEGVAIKFTFMQPTFLALATPFVLM